MKQKKAILAIKELSPHFLNSDINWKLLKESQLKLDINLCPEIVNCWKTRDHRKQLRRALKIRTALPSVRQLWSLENKLNDCITPVTS
jgi:hypothetical protein